MRSAAPTLLDFGVIVYDGFVLQSPLPLPFPFLYCVHTSMRVIDVAATHKLPFPFPFYSSTRFIRAACAGRGRRSPRTPPGAAVSVRGVQGHPSKLPHSDTDNRRDGDQGLEGRASRQSAGGRFVEGVPGESCARFGAHQLQRGVGCFVHILFVPEALNVRTEFPCFLETFPAKDVYVYVSWFVVRSRRLERSC